ncbi:hypothetical protein B0H19DRAFT_1275953 [Mycena capillaripes]|nr:hypothetical protein B0H19DRAFT_1275953 [Mycena capillaripes]
MMKDDWKRHYLHPRAFYIARNDARPPPPAELRARSSTIPRAVPDRSALVALIPTTTDPGPIRRTTEAIATVTQRQHLAGPSYDSTRSCAFRAPPLSLSPPYRPPQPAASTATASPATTSTTGVACATPAFLHITQCPTPHRDIVPLFACLPASLLLTTICGACERCAAFCAAICTSTAYALAPPDLRRRHSDLDTSSSRRGIPSAACARPFLRRTLPLSHSSSLSTATSVAHRIANKGFFARRSQVRDRRRGGAWGWAAGSTGQALCSTHALFRVHAFVLLIFSVPYVH